MTMLNTDIPGVTVEVTDTVNYGPQRPSQVRLQAWAQYPDPDNPGAHLIDLRFTPEQAMQLSQHLAHAASFANVS